MILAEIGNILTINKLVTTISILHQDISNSSFSQLIAHGQRVTWACGQRVLKHVAGGQEHTKVTLTASSKRFMEK